MTITFSSWLRRSNEAKPLRDAFSLIDQMPQDFGLKSKTFGVVQSEAERRWSETKSLLVDDGAAKE